ncbi:MAG: class I tRNA ligase family protein [Puniceicoccaceae bacterium]
MKKFYVTTAIDYANGLPHLGHAYEKVLADVIARSRRMAGREVFFLTGMDEHGQKVQQSARKQGVEPIEFTDRLAGHFQGLCRDLSISNDDFIRTTEERHRRVVRDLLQRLYDAGEIYEAEHSGFYSTRAEQFVLEKDKVDGRWPEEFGEVQEIRERNYYFRQSAYQDWLIGFLRDHPDFIYPRFRLSQVLEFLKEPLNDLCVSRPVERLSWGIPLPFDENFVTYVWFDALTNYITAAGYGTGRFDEVWPADCHVIGKDILLPPHAVYWPIMLHACGIEPPKHLLVHGWWTLSGSKMSKSAGQVVDPLALIERFGADAFRYFVMREMTVGQDSDFSEELFFARYNGELGNDLGNLLSRLLNMGARYAGGEVPAVTVEEEPETALMAKWREVWPGVRRDYEGFLFHSALESVFDFVKAINRYAEQRAPWKLAKSDSPEDRKLLETSLGVMAEGLRLAAGALVPVTPGVSATILDRIGAEAIDRWDDRMDWGRSLAGRRLGGKIILFPRP